MSAFTNDENPIGRYLYDGQRFQLFENLIYHVGSECSDEIIFIPDGFVTDWASIPNCLQRYLPQRYGRRAAVVHDYLYSTSGLGGKYSRKRCDEIFLESLMVLNVSAVRARILYMGVKIGGHKAWNKYQKKNRILQYEHEDRIINNTYHS